MINNVDITTTWAKASVNTHKKSGKLIDFHHFTVIEPLVRGGKPPQMMPYHDDRTIYIVSYLDNNIISSYCPALILIMFYSCQCIPLNPAHWTFKME